MFTTGSFQRVGIILACASVLLVLPAAAHDIHYTGRATGINGTVTVHNSAGSLVTKKLLIVDLAMNCTGAPREDTASALSTPAPVLVQAQTVRGYLVGNDGVTAATAGIETLKLELEGHTVEATLLHSNAEATCHESDLSITTNMNSSVATLKIDGRSQALTTQPNQRIPIPGLGELIVNEQAVTANWKSNKEVTVSALHLAINQSQTGAKGDLWFATSRAKVYCGR
jgi:hypothetical protein